MRQSPAAARGTTLVEALVAFLLLSLGLMATVRLQSGLRSAADTARQRAEAVRLAEDDLERLRSFASVAASGSRRSYADVVSASRTLDASAVSPGSTPFRLERTVRTAGVASAREVRVGVAWEDAGGTTHRVLLASMIGAHDPALTGALALVPTGPAPAAAPNR